MERRRAYLEGQTRQHQRDGDHQRTFRHRPQPYGLANLFEIGGAGQPVQQRHAEQQQVRGKGAGEEVLHRRLDGALLVAEETGQQVGAERHQLQTHEEGDEVDRFGHDNHADGSEEHQRVVIAQ